MVFRPRAPNKLCNRYVVGRLTLRQGQLMFCIKKLIKHLPPPPPALKTCILRYKMDAAASVVTPQVKLYNLERYTFHVKEPKLEKDTSVHARLKRMKSQYEVEGN